MYRLSPARNIRSPLISFRPENSYNTMPADRHRLLLVYRRRVLVESFVPSPLIRVYKNCEKSHTPEKYKLGGTSDRCIECARKGRSYNLAPFSLSKWARIRQ